MSFEGAGLMGSCQEYVFTFFFFHFTIGYVIHEYMYRSPFRL